MARLNINDKLKRLQEHERKQDEFIEALKLQSELLETLAELELARKLNKRKKDK